ncbi:Os03g0799900, partial [Oryza sativa Japonica Group]
SSFRTYFIFLDVFSPFVIRGSHDSDFCVVDVKKMEVLHLSKKVHLGSPISSIEFCPTER